MPPTTVEPDIPPPGRSCLFWLLAPWVLTFLVLMPLLVHRRDAPALVVMGALEVLGALFLIAAFAPYQMLWAWRAMAATVFLAFVVYLAAEAVDQGPPRADRAKSVASAIAGLIVIGMPALAFAVTGRTPRPLAWLGQWGDDVDNPEQTTS